MVNKAELNFSSLQILTEETEARMYTVHHKARHQESPATALSDRLAMGAGEVVVKDR